MNAWIQRTNIYEVNVRQYTPEGTLRAFATHLPRLKDMGVETLWFMPLTPISQKNKKGSMGSYYACSDYTAVATEFGTLDDFKNLVQEAHDMGFKVIIDWVANHTGWDHWWTVQHTDWYEKEDNGDFKKASGMDDIIELDFKNPELRKAMIEAMKFWVATGIDGFRCDLAFWVELNFWMEAKAELDKIKPLFWLGELDVLEHGDYMQVFDAAYTWIWMHKTEQYYKGGLVFNELMHVLEHYKAAVGIPAWFTTNHDENTWNGTEYEKYGGLAKAFAVFSCTWPGLPLVYSGQEVPNYKRLQFFEKDVIEWKEPLALHHFYKTLFQLRKTNRALSADAPVQSWKNADEAVLSFIRTYNDQSIMVVINFSPEAVMMTLPQNSSLLNKEIFSGDDYHHFTSTATELQPGGFWVFSS